MALQVSERHAAVGAGVATALPVAVNQVGLDQMLGDVADRVFEGDRAVAGRIVAGVFGALGLALAALGIVGPLNGTAGILSISAGVSSLGIAVEALMAGGA
jgi:hypothetical protein